MLTTVVFLLVLLPHENFQAAETQIWVRAIKRRTTRCVRILLALQYSRACHSLHSSMAEPKVGPGWLSSE